ncbi:hypothetical protein L3Y34_019174 [Caenorhabditis briggsae]|nr:hypothetical protein L3Y34_019174 [Caenorhabditis briggsae]
MLLSKIQALQTGLHEVTNIVIENLTSQKSQQYLTEELVENQKEREIQKKLFGNYVAVHERTLLELEDSRKIQKEQEEKINIITEENEKFDEIRGKFNEENEKIREELEDFEENLTSQKSQEQENREILIAKLTEEFAECEKEREIQKKQFEDYVDVHEGTLLELEDSRKIQKEQKEKINILTEENEKFSDIRQKLNEENEKLREELQELKLKLESIEENKTFQIFVRISNYITLSVKKTDTIADVKDKMCKRGFPCNDCFLIYGGKLLEDSCALFDYNIEKNSTLFVSNSFYRSIPDRTQ